MDSWHHELSKIKEDTDEHCSFQMEGHSRQIVETPLVGDFEGKALYLATHVTRPPSGTDKRQSKVSAKNRDVTPRAFDPENDFTFESEAVSPDPLPNREVELKESYRKLCRSMKVTPCSAITKQLGSTNVNLSQLKLNRKEFKAIMTILLNDTELVDVNLTGNPITHREASYIGELLKGNKFISHLTLSEMNLTGSPMSELAKVLKSCMGLIQVDLSSNFLSDKDGDSICSLIDDTDGIRELILHHNQLGECGVQLGRSIADNVTITRLDLSWNHIRGTGAVGVARGLQRNQRLVDVKLSWNGFGFEGCVALSHMLCQNTTLQMLDLTSNRIHLPALHKLMDGVVRNKVLTVLKIGFNPIPAHCTSYMLDRIRKWKQSALKEVDMEGVVVDKEFEPILKDIQEGRWFLVRYDKSLPIQKKAATQVDSNNIFNIDPIRILFFMKQHLRTIDLFLKIDKDISGSLTRDEMKYAFELEGYPISDMALDQVMGYLDTNNDGDVDLQEFFDGERRAKRELIKEAEEQQSTSNRLKPAINMIKYSQAFKASPEGKTPGISPRSNTFA